MSIVKKESIENKIRCLLLSSNLLESVYDPSNKTLILTFRQGRVYQYHNIEPKIYEQFEQSESHGITFYKLIKPALTTRLNDVDPTALLTELAAKV